MRNASSAPPVPGRQHGFTLMEVLIAVSITAVIGLGVWQVISSVIQSRDRVDAVAEEFDALQRTMLLLERDITQVVNRPARNIYGDFEPSFGSQDENYALALTRQGWRNPLGIRRSELQRSAWEYTGEELRRRYWVMVDQGQEEESRDQVILEKVEAFDVRFLDSNNNWTDEWPPSNQGTPTGSGAAAFMVPLPLAVEVTLTHERFGELRRLLTLPDYDYQGVQNRFSQQNAGGDNDADNSDDAQTGNGQGGGGNP